MHTLQLLTDPDHDEDLDEESWWPFVDLDRAKPGVCTLDLSNVRELQWTSGPGGI